MSISPMTMDFSPFKYICCSFLTDKLLTSMFSLYNVQCFIRNRNWSLSSTRFTRSVLSGTGNDGTGPWRAHGSPAVFYQEQELILGEHMVHSQCLPGTGTDPSRAHGSPAVFYQERNWSLVSTWFTRSALPGTGTDPSRAHGSHAVFLWSPWFFLLSVLCFCYYCFRSVSYVLLFSLSFI